MIRKRYFKISFLILLLKVFSLIDKKGKNKLFYLLSFVILQAIFDVFTIASLTPLIQIITNKDKLEIYIRNLMGYFNLDRFHHFNLITNDLSLTFVIPFTVILIMIISTLVRIYVVHKTNDFTEEIRHQISTELMEKYIYSDLQYKINSSEVAKSILSEVDQFIIVVFRPIILMLTNLLVLSGIILYLIYTNIQVTFFSLILLFSFYFFFYIFSKRKLNLAGYESEKANKGRFLTAIEVFSSIKDIKIYKAENYFINRFKKFSKIFTRTMSYYTTLTACPKYILEMIVFIAIALSVCLILILKVDIFSSLPLLGIFAFAAYRAQPALSNILYGINSIEYGSKIINNLHSSLNNPNQNKFINKNNIYIISKSNSRNSLIIENLKFIYDNKKGIKNINFSLDVPSLFVLVGPSGCGKSTLLNLISGNLRQQEGQIYLTKKGSRKYPKISYLHQEYTLYDATIAENIAFGISKDKIDYSHLKKVLILSEIYEYINTLQNGVDEIIGEKGSNLSVGQRQRIALARALYFKPDILILDEPTSSLDKENEEKIIKTLIKISKKIIVIMSSHKLNYIPNGVKIGFLRKNGIEIK